MKRLSDTELDARIHKFLDRKFSEFPELAETEVGPARAAHGKPAKVRPLHP